MLLNLLSDTTSIFPPRQPIIDSNHSNKLMDEIYKMLKLAKYTDLLNFFREMLQIAKKKYLKQEEHSKSNDWGKDIDFNKAFRQINEIHQKYGMSHFPDAFFALIKYISKN
jgi:hypothetical protein